MSNTIIVILPDKDSEESRIQIETCLLQYDYKIIYTPLEQYRDTVTSLNEKKISVIIDCDGKNFQNPVFTEYLQSIQHPIKEPSLLTICTFPVSYDYQETIMRIGSDILIRPFSAEELALKLHKLSRIQTGGTQDQKRSDVNLKKIVGDDPTFRGEIDKIPVIASCDAATLIEGETGTGKELIARAIHALSDRNEKPFIAVNCGAIPVELVENELFGHHREAFTGANSQRHGLIHEANGGTLFFDEIDALPLVAQSKLLRFIQEKEYRPLGSSKNVTADIRIISASNQNLEKLSEAKAFRTDLYYRLNVLKISLPPLRSRPQDIFKLFSMFILKHAENRSVAVPQISHATMNYLSKHNWPGNVRELDNVAERALVYCHGKTIEPRHLNLPGLQSAILEAKTLKDAKSHLISRFEQNYITDLLILHKGNITQAAEAAGKNRRAFFELMRKYKIEKAITLPPS